MQSEAVCSLGRLEYGRLAPHAGESDTQYQQRMKGAGLGFRSRVSKPGLSTAQELAAALNVSLAEATAMLAAVPSTKLPELSDGDAAEQMDTEAESDEDDQSEHDPSPGALPDQAAVKFPRQPPAGFHYRVSLERRRADDTYVRVRYNVRCAQHQKFKELRSPKDVAIFLNTHAQCRCAAQCKAPQVPHNLISPYSIQVM